MANRDKTVQIKFHLDKEKAQLLREYSSETGRTKQDIFENAVDMLIGHKVQKKERELKSRQVYKPI